MARTFRTVIVPTDFSDPATNALHAALDLKDPEGMLYLVHVVDDVPLTYGYVGMALPADDLRTRLARTAHDELVAFVPAGADMKHIETHILHGSPWDRIVEFARTKQADLIVMGTHGRAGIGHALIGSVAERVLRRAPCPVLVIREGGAGYPDKAEEHAEATS